MMRFWIVTMGLLALLLAACLLGGLWIWASLVYISVFAYGVDRLGPVLLANADPQAEFPAAGVLSICLALAHFGVLALAVDFIVHAPASVWEKGALFTAVALFAGQVGHPNAHELIHRPSRGLRRLGKAVYCSIAMGHHASAHPLVHHVHCATPRDPVSAPRGRGFWRFFVPAWIGSFKAGYAAESRRHSGLAHPYLAYAGGAVLALGAALWIGGITGAAVWALIGGYAQLQIFLSDYVQHYGLRRRISDTGKPEPVGPQHSWNTPHQFSGAMMLNAPRHSDHHTHPQRLYPALQLTPETMPMLPYSLPMMAVIALMPPLWRKIMDPRVDRWASAP